jgi:hypothetical protein
MDLTRKEVFQKGLEEYENGFRSLARIPIMKL